MRKIKEGKSAKRKAHGGKRKTKASGIRFQASGRKSGCRMQDEGKGKRDKRIKVSVFRSQYLATSSKYSRLPVNLRLTNRD